MYLHPLPSLETGKDSCQWPWCQCDQPGWLLSSAYGRLAWPDGPRPPPAEARCLLRGQKHKPSCAAPPGLPAGPLPGMAPPPGQPSRCLVLARPSLSGSALGRGSGSPRGQSPHLGDTSALPTANQSCRCDSHCSKNEPLPPRSRSLHPLRSVQNSLLLYDVQSRQKFTVSSLCFVLRRGLSM